MKVLILTLCLSFAFSYSYSNNLNNTYLPTEGDSSKAYNFKVRLIKKENSSPDCGILAWALAQKFEVIETNFPSFSRLHIILIQSCPELLGSDFFNEGNAYIVTAHLKILKGYGIINNYSNSDIPIFWCSTIKKIK